MINAPNPVDAQSAFSSVSRTKNTYLHCKNTSCKYFDTSARAPLKHKCTEGTVKCTPPKKWSLCKPGKYNKKGAFFHEGRHLAWMV